MTVGGDLTDGVHRRRHDLQVLYDAKRLGTVLFQFPPSFEPSPASIAIVEECRALLLPEFPMAIEFRNRKWLGLDSVSGISTATASK
jgi:uncharacterized protein YecE (DUF72 family)